MKRFIFIKGEFVNNLNISLRTIKNSLFCLNFKILDEIVNLITKMDQIFIYVEIRINLNKSTLSLKWKIQFTDFFNKKTIAIITTITTMNKLLLLLAVFTCSFNSFSQNELVPQSNQDPYLIFRSKKMFFIKQISDEKIINYPVLTSISYIDVVTKEEKFLTAEEFVILFNEGEINNLSLKIPRNKFIELSYRIGDTGYVLIGKSEEQITTEFNQTIK